MKSKSDDRQAALERENAELRRQLAESLAQQTATSDVLRVISRARGEFGPVLDALLETGARLCTAEQAVVTLRDPQDGLFHYATSFGYGAEFKSLLVRNPVAPGRTSLIGRTALEAGVVHIEDAPSDPEYQWGDALRLGRWHTGLGVPLLRDGQVIGVLALTRRRVERFTDKQIELVQTFADQAVIAIENARLVEELRVSQARHGLVVDAVAEGIYEWNIEQNALWVSPRLFEIFGFVGQALAAGDWNERVYPGDFERYRGALKDCLAGRASQLDCEYRVRHDDGAYRWVEDRGVVIRDDAGRAVRLTGAIADISARKAAEQQLREALEQQTATAEVLGVINASPGDLAPVFEAILEKAHHLCGATQGTLQLYDGTHFRAVATHGLRPEWAAAQYHPRPPTNEADEELLAGARLVHYPDLAALAEKTGDARMRSAAASGVRTILRVPFRRDGKLLGYISAYREEVKPFSEPEITLLESFAQQAAIAIENARLITETREALDQQTATAEVLGVINSSPGDLAPVFEAILDKAHALCGAERGTLFLYDRDSAKMKAAVAHGYPADVVEHLRAGIDVGAANPRYAALFTGNHVHIHDLTRIGGSTSRVVSGRGGVRTNLLVPLFRNGVLLGMISCNRTEVRPFTDKEIALIENFAAQAVIAMENARLITETQEALDQQTATAEVLGVINSSPGHLAPVFDAMLEKAMRLCGADLSHFMQYDGGRFHTLALRGATPAYAEFMSRPLGPSETGGSLAALVRGEAVAHVPDLKDSEAYRSGNAPRRALVDLGRARTGIWIALRNETGLRGALVLYRTEVQPFSDKQIALLQNFAVQAVIAMENARLLTETREALDRQTATAEVLGVINSSPGDLTPVFDAILEKAHALCAAPLGSLVLYEGENLRTVATRGYPEHYAALARQGFSARTFPLFEELARGEVTQAADLASWELQDGSIGRAAVDMAGIRTSLQIPLRREGRFLGYISAQRQEVRLFADKEIALLQNFAAQAVIAMENARLLTETREALDRQTATAEILRVIAAAPGDAEGTLKTIAETTAGLFSASGVAFRIAEGDEFTLTIGVGRGAEAVNSALYQGAPRIFVSSRALPSTVVRENRQIHLPDLDHLPPEVRDWPGPPILRAAGVRTLASTPLRREGHAFGALNAYRDELRPFSPEELRLLQSFADQAAIAIENARLITETREALEQQTATAEVLGVISSSPGDLAPVFDAILDKALRLCGGAFGTLHRYDGELFHVMTGVHRDGRTAEAVRKRPPFRPTPGGPLHRIVQGEPFASVEDLLQDHVYRGEDQGSAQFRPIVDSAGYRSMLAVALRKDGVLLGDIGIFRTEPGKFSEKQIALLQNFAAQAVVAIENARLITETREALEQQTATAEVLGVINASPGELAPVFDAILEKAHRLCGATRGTLFLFEGETFRAAAMHGYPKGQPPGIIHVSEDARLASFLAGERLIHIPDLTKLDDPVARAVAERGGVRTNLLLPLRRDRALLGVISCNRSEVRPFSDKEIALLENFAAQAVIAMENARLLTETRERTADLQQALTYQTATSEVLRIVASSPDRLEPVFDAILDRATELCEVQAANLYLHVDGVFRAVAARHPDPAMVADMIENPVNPGPGTAIHRAFTSKMPVHIRDIADDSAYGAGNPFRMRMVERGVRAVLLVPLVRGNEAIGVVTIYRPVPEPYTEAQIELVRTFADQAVIAIENARLFDEIHQRQAELRVTFDNMADGVVMFDEHLRLAAWNKNFQELLDLPDELLEARKTYAEYLHILADRGEFGPGDVQAELDRRLAHADEELRFERTRPDGTILEVRRNAVAGGGFVLIYSDITERKRSEEEIRLARDAAEAALNDLKAAQGRLIQAEKMASLGQLTAGIAHEIKNPLNFVNNFASLSNELLDELKDIAAPALESLDEEKREELDETMAMLSGNLDKIAEHGKRADNIVKSMLEHSRGVSGERRAVDLNALVEESLNLAYHGARAQDQSFNITLERDFDEALRPVDLVPQDMTRVFLNLIGNGFYAANKRAQKSGNGFRPVLRVATHEAGDTVEVRVRDNGTGIPAEIRDKLFQPFFTTKPTGEGTGLGLSISYDIVTQQHGGSIAIDSAEGEFTEFTIRLPRGGHGGRQAR